MKAIVSTEYGSPNVLQFKDVEKPTPKDNEVLIKIHAASVNAADLHLLRADPFLVRFESGLLKPKRTILGADVAGRVESIGKNVTQFKLGDEVFGDISASGFGGFAEYVSANENALVLKPAQITFEAAASAPMAAVTALQGLRDKGQIESTQKVLIVGASGGVGTFATQIAKSFGTDVTAVCSTSKIDMVRTMGADHVIDYTQEDFSKNGQQYDLILGANGNYSLADYKRALKPEGIYVCTGGSMKQIFESMLLGAVMSTNGNKKLVNLASQPNQKDLIFIKELLEAGKVIPVIDRTYPLRETAEAMRYLETGHAKGKVIITL